jgi:hypothetical protein
LSSRRQQGNQFCGGFEADIEKYPTGVFFKEGGEKGVSRLAGSVQQSYVQQS